MKKKTAIRLAAMLLAIALAAAVPLAALAEADAEPLFVIRENDLYGYMNARGETVLEPQWSFAGDFRGNYAMVSVGDYDGIIDREGNYVVPPEYLMDEGYDGQYYGGKDSGIVWAMGSNGGGLGFFDIPSGYFSGTLYSETGWLWGMGEGLVAVSNEDDVYGYVDRATGEVVIPFRYECDVSAFDEGFACAYIDDVGEVYELFDKTGKVLELPEGIIPASPCFSGGLLMVRDTATNLCGFADASGTVVIPAVYEQALDFSEGYAAVCVGGLWGHIDEQGYMVCEPKFNSSYKFVNGFAILYDEDAAIVLDTLGGELFRMDGMSIGFFTDNGIAAYNPAGDYESFGIVDITGEVMLPVEAGYRFEITYAYGYEELFADGLQVLTKDGLFGFVDEGGQVVIDFQYSYAENFVDGLACVKTAEGKLAYINFDGEIVWIEK